MKSIIEMIAGSQLYGTATLNSDTDYKGVFLPTWNEIALGKIPRNIHETTGDNISKNSKDDVDREFFGIHEFIKLCLEGQTIAFDMLHTPSICYITEPHDIWNTIVDNKEKFYSKNIHTFIGYACGQASRYSLKGDRLNQCKQVITFLDTLPCKSKLMDCDLTSFPTGEYIKFIPWEETARQHINLPKIDLIEVCSKQFQVSCSVEYAKDIVQKYIDKYGARAQKAADDEGRDWKAISHAFRVCYEAKELFTDYTITFPRPESAFLLQIKTGQLSYVNLASMLDELIDEVKGLKENSNLPDKPDRKFWDNFLLDIADYIRTKSKI